MIENKDYSFAISVQFHSIIRNKLQAKSAPDVVRLYQGDGDSTRSFTISLSDFSIHAASMMREANKSSKFILYGNPYMYITKSHMFMNLDVQHIEPHLSAEFINRIEITTTAMREVVSPTNLLYHNRKHKRSRNLLLQLFGGNCSALLPDELVVPDISIGDNINIKGFIDTYGGSHRGVSQIFYNHIVVQSIRVDKGLF